jgi:hypothetical protein
VDHSTLPYAPARIRSDWNDDGLTIDFVGGAPAGDFWIRVGAMGLVVAIGLVTASLPRGFTIKAGVVLVHPGTWDARLVGLFIAASVATLIYGAFRTRHLPTTITVRGRVLTFSVPGAWRISQRRYDLSRYADIDVDQDLDSVYLVLRASDGRRAADLKGDAINRSGRAELAVVADTLRRAAWAERFPTPLPN